MNMSIWNPDYFISNFGDRKNILVDCSTHHQIDNQSMDKFWQGFIGVAYRLRNRSTNQPMVLKLKDWPPSDDFAEILPRHFRDIMDALPLPHYTSRTGKFNLASHLPKHFVKPDLGPKMYSAYGHSDQIKKGEWKLIEYLNATSNFIFLLRIHESPSRYIGCRQCDGLCKFASGPGIQQAPGRSENDKELRPLHHNNGNKRFKVRFRFPKKIQQRKISRGGQIKEKDAGSLLAHIRCKRRS